MGSQPQPANADAAALVARFREGLNDYAATLPHPEFAELGYAVRVRSLRSGILRKLHLDLLVESRAGTPEYQTLDGNPRSLRDLEASSTDLVPVAQEPDPDCPLCEGEGMIACPRCDSDDDAPAGGLPCAKCEGSGEVRCRGCSGVGTTSHRSGKHTVKRKCMKCMGSGRLKCDACGGTKTGICALCAGTRQLACACTKPATASPTATVPVPAHLAALDLWSFERETPQGFAPFEESWTVEPDDAEPIPCPACEARGRKSCTRCQGKGHTLCAACHGAGNQRCPSCRGSGCAACKDKGHLPCPTCNSHPERSCLTCAGNGHTPCRLCDSKGKLHARLTVHRKLEVVALTHYLANLPHDDLSISHWEQPGDFTPEAESKLEGPPDPAFWPSLPEAVVKSLLTMASETVPSEDGSRRIARHHLQTATTHALYALYAHDNEDYDAWLLGPNQRLLAPSNPITQRLDDDLKQVHTLLESGDHAGATDLLRQCQGILAADPSCKERLDRAQALLDEESPRKIPAWMILAPLAVAVPVVLFLITRLF